MQCAFKLVIWPRTVVGGFVIAERAQALQSVLTTLPAGMTHAS